MSGYYEGLAERARLGDRHAWELLWEHLSPQIYSKLRPLLKGVPGMEPEDVLGWVMGEAWRLVCLHDPSRSRVSTFVLNGLRGRLQNLRRDALAKGRSAFYLAARPTDDHDPTEVPDERPLREYERTECWADIDTALSGLPIEHAHASVIEAVRKYPDATISEISRIAMIRESEAHRFFRGVGPVIAAAELGAGVRRRRAKRRHTPESTLF